MPTRRANILIVDDELIKRSILEDQLRVAGYAVETASSPLEAEPKLAASFFDVVLTDLRMPHQDGLTFLRELKRRRPEQAAIVMTAYGTVETAVEAMKLGAFDFLQKPFATEELLLKLEKLLQYEQLASENEVLRRQLAISDEGRRAIGQSEAMRKVLERVHVVAGTDTTVLIDGESGVGKTLIAREIHQASQRCRGPFVPVSCAALPKDLIETELFGHEAGAFTGASRRRLGRFELAHGGTLFLDDIDDISLDVQVKLLHVLQERSFERVGGEEVVRINVRVIAATKKSIASLVAEGKFREDLYYRLNVVPLHIPPLRERLDDIPLLVEHLVERLAVRLNRGHQRITTEALAKLCKYSWPGNVRELEHVLERSIALSSDDVLDAADLPDLLPPDPGGKLVSLRLEHESKVDLPGVIEDVEARIIRWALQRCDGNLARAAEMLGVARSTLQYKAGKLTKQARPDPAEPSRRDEA